MNGMTFDGYMNVLGALVKAENGDAVLETLPEATQRQFLTAAISERIGVYCLWKAPRCCKRLADMEAQLQIQDYKLQVQNCLNKQILLKLYAKLEEQKIFFVPLKGADLAYRVYPLCHLRSFSDFDILFKREQWPQIEKFFVQEGWAGTVWKINENMHHIPPLFKGNLVLEPHWTLPFFEGVAPDDLWNYCHPVASGSYRCQLSPELNMLMLVRHLRERDYIRCKLSRFLLDAHFLLKHETVEWEKVREMCRQWHFTYPGNLMGAFPEVFGDDLLKEISPDLSRAKMYREIFKQREAFMECTDHELQVHEMMTGQSQRLQQWLYHLSPSGIRRKYALPEDTNMLKVFGYTIKDIYIKACIMLGGIVHPHHELKDYLELVDKADK